MTLPLLSCDILQTLRHGSKVLRRNTDASDLGRSSAMIAVRVIRVRHFDASVPSALAWITSRRSPENGRFPEAGLVCSVSISDRTKPG